MEDLLHANPQHIADAYGLGRVHKFTHYRARAFELIADAGTFVVRDHGPAEDSGRAWSRQMKRVHYEGVMKRHEEKMRLRAPVAELLRTLNNETVIDVMCRSPRWQAEYLVSVQRWIKTEILPEPSPQKARVHARAIGRAFAEFHSVDWHINESTEFEPLLTERIEAATHALAGRFESLNTLMHEAIPVLTRVATAWNNPKISRASAGIHGDPHSGNVVFGTAPRRVILVDLDGQTPGNPIEEAAYAAERLSQGRDLRGTLSPITFQFAFFDGYIAGLNSANIDTTLMPDALLTRFASGAVKAAETGWPDTSVKRELELLTTVSTLMPATQTLGMM